MTEKKTAEKKAPEKVAVKAAVRQQAVTTARRPACPTPEHCYFPGCGC